MSTKGSLYFKAYFPEDFENIEHKYLSVHVFEETMTAPPYRVDFEVELNGLYLRGVLNADCIEELEKAGLIKRAFVELNVENKI